VADRFLTSLQRKYITQAIRDGHLAYIAEMFGPTAIDHDDYERLHNIGKIRDEKLLPQDIALAVHTLGTVTGNDTHKALSPDDFWRQVKNNPQVITEAEREQVAILRDRMGQHVRGLGNRLDTITGHILVDVDEDLRRKRLTKLQRETLHGLEARAAAEEVARRLRDAMRELKRDWLRTAHTEMHNAKEEAKAIVLAHRSPNRDPRVFKRPRHDACRFCVMLYLRPDGVTPRVFKLSELLANGTNVGRKAGQPSRSGKSRTQWKAVIGAMHPFCQCELHLLPDGFGFDSSGQLTYIGLDKSVPVEVLDKALATHECEEP
jgi:hypothetical protein